MRGIKKSIASLLSCNFILVIIQACFFSSLLHAMDEDESLPPTPGIRQEKLLPERTKEDSDLTSLQVSKRDMPLQEDPIKEDTALFLLMPVDFHVRLDSYLDLPSQWNLARVCKTTLGISALLTFRQMYLSLPQEIRSHLFGVNVSSQQAYKIFRKLSNQDALEALYAQSLLLEFRDKKNYTSLRLVILENPHFKKEEDANKKAKKIFCLGEQEQEKGSWVKTLILHRLFWEGYNNPQILDWLRKQGFYLAQLLENMGEDLEKSSVKRESCSERQKNAQSILSAIALTQRKCINDTAAIGSCGWCFVSLAKVCGLLSKKGTLSEALDKLALESDCLSYEEGAKKQFLQLLTSQKKPTNSTINYDYEPLIFFLSRGLVKMENRREICELATEGNFVGLEFTFMNVCLDSISNFYAPQLVNLYTELLESGNTLFILLWQHDSSFLVGLSEDNQAALYYKAQSAYQEKFGKVYSGQFIVNPTFPLSEEGVSHRFSRFYVEGSDTYAEEAERRWGSIAELGDPLVAFELTKTWKTSQEVGTQERATYWFLRYKELAPDLPFGDFGG